MPSRTSISLLITAVFLCSCTGQAEVKQDTSSAKPAATKSAGAKFVDATTLPDTDPWTIELQRRQATGGPNYAVGARVVLSYLLRNTGSETTGLSITLEGPALQKGILSGENAVRIAVAVNEAGHMKSVGQYSGNLAMTAPGICTATYPTVNVPANSYIQLLVLSQARTAGQDAWKLTVSPLASTAGAFMHSDTTAVH